MYRVTWLVFLGVLHRLKPSSERPTQLNSTQLNSVSFSHDPVYVWPHDVNINTNIIYLITDIMYCVYKNVHGNGVVGRRDSSGLLWIYTCHASHAKMVCGGDPFYLKIWVNQPLQHQLDYCYGACTCCQSGKD